ncbi:head-tail connector protein [Paracoccus rhizosphaerae]|uniref:Head-tail connector protein n=1 Tax=Paracoccus rhizosphaerae TaxID=1133347 RepID=A0ABV6CDS8_9RHOB|nr:head-tail connector protein [Paracoccus rhizosphaerae]
MPTIVTLSQIKDHLALTGAQDQDDMLIQLKLDAAQSLIERHLGYGLILQFGSAEAVPADLREAILQLTAWWYENREAVMERGAPLPFGVQDILDAHRDWSF